MDLEGLDHEEVDKEMEMDEASQSAAVAPEGNAPESTPNDVAGGDEAAT